MWSIRRSGGKKVTAAVVTAALLFSLVQPFSTAALAGEADAAAMEVSAAESAVSEASEAEEAAPAAEETSAAEETPVAEEAPAAEETSAVEEAPAAEETSAAEETPAAEEAPAAEAAPAEEAAPAAAEEAAPAEKAAPAKESAPAAEESAPAAEAAPANGAAAPKAAGSGAETPQATEESSSDDDYEGGITLGSSGSYRSSSTGSSSASSRERSTEIEVGDFVITASGAFPEDTVIQAVQIPGDAAAKMAGKASSFAYDIRLVSDGKVWQPEDYGEEVKLYIRKSGSEADNVNAELLHVKTDLMDADGNLSSEALEKVLRDVESGSAVTEQISADTDTRGLTFDTSSFSAFIGDIGSRVVYVYNATLFNNDSANYPGVYSTKITPNKDSAETAKTAQTIGIASIADENLANAPTTESPAIIQGAAVGYEEKTGATEYTKIKDRPEPYSEFRVKAMDEKGQDGTTHRKLTGFDGTYVIVRLDVSEFFASGSDNLYLHMEQKDNKALMPAVGMTPVQDANGNDIANKFKNEFTDMMGNRTGSYLLKDLIDPNGTTPYVDILVFATAANVAGADAGKTGVANGDIPLAFYVDNTADYNPSLKYDPNYTPTGGQTAEQYNNSILAKFFDAAKASVSKGISHYLLKGSDLALETAVEMEDGTKYWSLKKSLEDPYYDQAIDSSPSDPGSGRTVKMISEVAVTKPITLAGVSSSELKKRTLDVNSFDIQVASNTTSDTKTYSDGFNLQNAWLTIKDGSNTTGAEMAIGNNARFTIGAGGKLIIDQTCQLEIEWDGATTTPGSTAKKDILNNGQLNLLAGGEIVNNGIITIEGTEGKPQQNANQQPANTDLGSGEMTIAKGATLTNNGALVVFGKLYNLGTVVNNGKYNDVITSNDPDKGKIDYHRGIQVSWKDDVTQPHVVPGRLVNGKDGNGTVNAEALLENYGDIVLVPGILENYGVLYNYRGGHIYEVAATEAIIPINPDPKTPTIVTKRITLNPPQASSIINYGTLINYGRIEPVSVELVDDGFFGALTVPGSHPELFTLQNLGTVENYGYIYGWPSPEGSELIGVSSGSDQKANDTWLYLYKDGTFILAMADGTRLKGTFEFDQDKMVFILPDEIVVVPENQDPAVKEDGVFAIPENKVRIVPRKVEKDENVEKKEKWAYSFILKTGKSVKFELDADFVSEVKKLYEESRFPGNSVKKKVELLK